MFAIIRTRWHTRPLSRRAKRRSSAAPGSLRKKYAGIAYPPNMVRFPNHSTTSGDHRKPVLRPAGPGGGSAGGLARLLQEYPDLTVTKVMSALVYSQKALDRMAEGLRMAGMPE
jgi:hypothetical protein